MPLILLALLVSMCFAWPGYALTYVVDAITGSDTASGSFSAPFRTLVKAAEVAVAPGDEVLVRPGVYTGTIQVQGVGTAQAPIVFRSSTVGAAVITGGVVPQDWPGDNDDNAAADANHDIVWQGFTFAGTGDFQLRAGEGWIIKENFFGGPGTNGINIRAHRVRVENNVFDGLAHHAIVASAGRDIQIKGNTWQRINAAGANDPANSAVTKFILTDRLLVENNLSQDNFGPGLWLDFNNTNYFLRGNRIRRNIIAQPNNWKAPGIWTEINTGPGWIVGNLIEDNSGAAISILESPNVTVQDNTIINGGYACFEFRKLDRGWEGYTIRNILISRNNCQPTFMGIFANTGDWTGWNAVTENVVIDQNTYTLGPGIPTADFLGVIYNTRANVCTSLGWECTP